MYLSDLTSQGRPTVHPLHVCSRTITIPHTSCPFGLHILDSAALPSSRAPPPPTPCRCLINSPNSPSRLSSNPLSFMKTTPAHTSDRKWAYKSVQHLNCWSSGRSLVYKALRIHLHHEVPALLPSCLIPAALTPVHSPQSTDIGRSPPREGQKFHLSPLWVSLSESWLPAWGPTSSTMTDTRSHAGDDWHCLGTVTLPGIIKSLINTNSHWRFAAENEDFVC